MRTAGLGAVFLVAVGLLPTGGSAQTITGRALSEGTGAPAATALIRVLDRDEKVLDAILADSLGRFHLQLRTPGEFYIDAQHLSYDYFRSPLLASTDRDATYTLDLEMKPVPIELEGITVTAVQSRVDTWLRGRIGMRAASLSNPMIIGPPIQRARLLNYTVTDLLRNNPTPGMTIMSPVNGPCFQLRARGCARIILDGAPISREMVEALPMDLIEAVVVLQSHETGLLYGSEGGAVIILTRGSVRPRGDGS